MMADKHMNCQLHSTDLYTHVRGKPQVRFMVIPLGPCVRNMDSDRSLRTATSTILVWHLPNVAAIRKAVYQPLALSTRNDQIYQLQYPAQSNHIGYLQPSKFSPTRDL